MPIHVFLPLSVKFRQGVYALHMSKNKAGKEKRNGEERKNIGVGILTYWGEMGLNDHNQLLQTC